MAAISYEFVDPSTGFRALLTVEERVDGALLFNIAVTSADIVGDMRALFFDLANESLLKSLYVVDGSDVTSTVFKANAVTNLGNGANVNGAVVNEAGKFDAGVQFGTAGIGKDDIQETSFVLKSTIGALSLSLFSGSDFALRATSVGDPDGARSDSLKLLGEEVTPPVLPGSLGDLVFFDDNRNGVQDPGESGVSGITVTLIGGGADRVIGTGGDDTAATTTTDGQGNYLFSGLTPGVEYKAMFSLPAGMAFTSRDVGTDDQIDSDADPTTGTTQIVTLASGEQNRTLDAGLLRFGSISGRYFCDKNENALDDGEPGVANRVVTLTGAGLDGVFGTGDDTVATTITGSDGSYSFTGLEAGNYTVAVRGAGFVAKDAGGSLSDGIDSDVDPTTGRTDPVSLAVGQVVTDVDAGTTCFQVPDTGRIGVNALLEKPLIFFNTRGTTTYDATGDTLQLDADALFMTSTPPVLFPANTRVKAEIGVDAAGDLIAGGADDFLIFADGDGDRELDAGEEVLLQGRIIAFGSIGAGAPTSSFDAIIEVAGGTLAGIFDPLVGIGWDSKESTFQGFGQDFSGLAKGSLGSIDVDCLC